jgi:hypothetical protein
MDKSVLSLVLSVIEHGSIVLGLYMREGLILVFVIVDYNLIKTPKCINYD